VDPKLLDSAEARYATLDRMVRERVLADAAEGAHLVTTAVRLGKEPSIVALQLPNGKYDEERFSQYAASQGLSSQGLLERIRKDLSIRQVEMGVAGTGLVSAAQANAALNAFFERRDIQVARFAPADFAAKINPTDADIDTFYQANQALFQAPEAANVEYVVLDIDSVKKNISINEQDLKTYYEQNAARLSGKEERRASHILINAPKEMPAAERQKAKDRALALQTQVKKSPDTFADVAKKNSQDTGSAANGGDLEFFGRGAMVKPFEEAVFAMKKGDVSDVVESDFGFHIIKLTDLKAPKQKSFEELRAGMEADLRTQQAQRKFAEVAVEFTNGVYEQSDNLKGIADKLKLEVKTASNLQRKATPAQTGVLGNAKLLAAIFSADSVDKKRNTEATEIAPNQLAAARITQYTAAHTLPLTEVKANVRERLVASRAAEAAKKEGLEKLESWKANAASASMPAAVVISREQGQNLAAPVLNAAMRADATTLPAWVGVDLGAQGYAVVRVNKVLERVAPTEAAAKQERAQYANWMAAAEASAYYQSLKEQYKAQIKVARPNSATPAAQ
jgi:peptidyl-prolyl cis-trans isomerase D